MTSRLSNDTLSRSYTLSPVKASVPAARTWVRQMLDRWKLPHFKERAELLISELITNAISHARTGGAPVTILLSYAAGTLRIEVHDRDASTLPVQQEPVVEEEGGRGLWIVAAYADRWDVDFAEDYKAVWAELDSPETTT